MKILNKGAICFLLLIILFSIILACILGLFPSIKFSVFDFFVRRSGIERSDRIVLIVIDEESEKELGVKDKYEWRLYHDELIKKIADKGAKAIGFDMTFEEETPYDIDFASAIKYARNKGVNVVLGTSYDSINSSFTETSPKILDADPLIGNIDAQRYTDRIVVRSIELLHKEPYQDDRIKGFRTIPAFVFQMLKERDKERLPLDKDGVMLINFTKEEFRKFSYSKVYNSKPSDGIIDCEQRVIHDPFKDKYVIVMSRIQEGSRDYHPTPLGRSLIGGEIHAQGLNTIIEKGYIKTLSNQTRAILIVLLNVIVSLLLISRWKLKWKVSILLLVICLLTYSSYFLFMFKPHCFLSLSDFLIGILITCLSFAGYTITENQRIIASYLGLPVKGYKILEEEFKRSKEFRKTITILYSDLRDYIKFTGSNSPDVVMSLMIEYYALVGKIITARGGYIYSCMGDAFVGIFGFPLQDKLKGRNREERALLSTMEMKKSIPDLFSKWKNDKRGIKDVPSGFGVGITTGEVTISNIASGKRVQMNIVGDSINLSARLESATKDVECLALITKETFQSAQHLIANYKEFKVTEHEVEGKAAVSYEEGTLSLKGVKSGLNLYAVELIKE